MDEKLIKTLKIVGIVVVFILLSLFVAYCIVIPVNTDIVIEEYEVDLLYDIDKGVYVCYCSELGNITYKTTELNVRYSSGANTGAYVLVEKEVVFGKVRKEYKKLYVLIGI